MGVPSTHWRDKKGMDEFAVYRALAAGVIDQAMTDFRKAPPRPFRAQVPDKIGRLRYKLIAVNKSIDAGQFLFQRDDSLVQLWYEWLGFKDLDALHCGLAKVEPKWKDRLAALEQAAKRLVFEIKRLERIPQTRKEAMTA